MNVPRLLTLIDPDYPSRLRYSPYAPACLATHGGSLEARVVVAIVGSRRANTSAVHFTERLSATLARAGAVVASGGAVGIDAAAHAGALGVGGRTWVVAGTGYEECFPKDHAQLFKKVAEGPGAMLWPSGTKQTRARRYAFPARNRVLVTLADAVIVVQARERSGALNAASWAIQLGRPLWVCPAPPWMKGFSGSRLLLQQGARLLTSRRALLEGLGLDAPPPAGARARKTADGPSGLLPLAQLSPTENKVLSALSPKPLHLDAVSTRSHLSAQETGAALLTLALENVVVEGPPGFFRRRNST